ncbi:TetR/AcrR family transcriptional regulator [Streptomyces sp. NBC_01476]|uniref:TetR/AcrR family transcriptional regulator n=1 Tax=Streptomyces sp. NBC_01476 TaxID=2903881 RepID=UPI002E3188D5|nr:TetR/AcrR family transcriptional regulator [Streptomyces sp. NBC_01476]
MGEKRAALLEAGLDAFIAEGLGGSSVNRIAAAAGVSIATLYRHFDSKPDLFVAVIHDLIRRGGTFAGRPWKGKPPREALTELGAAYLGHIHSYERRFLFRVMARDAYRVQGLYETYADEVMGSREGFFRECVEEWPDGLRAKLPDVARGALVLTAFLQGGLIEALMFRDSTPDPAALRAHAAFAADNFMTLVELGKFLPPPGPAGRSA